MNSIADAVIDLARKYFGEYKIKNGQLVPEYCPICQGGGHQDKETFAVNIHNGLYNCKRGSCPGVYGDGKGSEGNFKQLANFFGESGFEFTSLPKTVGLSKKVYDLPRPEDLKPLTDEAINYLASRMISKKTLEEWKIACDDKGNIVFPFYRDGKLVYVKYRKPKKYVKGEGPKEWQMSNTEPILFGMDMVSYNKPLAITEGELDCLAIYEAGYSNVVSVPSGCANMDWVTNCWDWLDKFSQIILFGDSDEPGAEMVSVLMQKLGEDRCMIPKVYPEMIFNGHDFNRPCKDANEILCCYGPEGLKELVESCEPAPIKGLLDVASIPFVDITQRPRIMTKFPMLDNLIGGLGEAGITVISGKRGEGKSTIGNSLMLNAIDQGYNACVYSGELDASTFKDWLYLTATESRYIGYKTDERSGKNICCISNEIKDRINKWLSGKMLLFDNSQIFDSDQQTAVLKCFEIAARRYNCKIFLVDNLMSLLTTNDEENKAQAKFMATLKAFASKYKVHVLCVCHPRKTKQGEAFTNDDVSGSSTLTNLADNVLSIERPSIRLTKNRSFGQTGFIQCDFDPTNRRIFQTSTGDRTVYGWDHNGIKLPENPACALEEFKLQSNKVDVPF